MRPTCGQYEVIMKPPHVNVNIQPILWKRRSSIFGFDSSNVCTSATERKKEDNEVVEEIKIVGYIMTHDMNTWSNTAYLTANAYKGMWFLQRLKANTVSALARGASLVLSTDTIKKNGF